MRPPLSTIAAGVFLLAALVALLFTDGLLKDTRRDRDAHVATAESLCAAAGAHYAPLDARGRPMPRKTWGVACLGRIQALVRDLAGYAAGSAQAVTDHQADTRVKGAADQGAARRDAARAGKARAKMETLDAAVEGDRVDGPWLRGLGELAGLPDAAPAAAAAAAAGDPVGDLLEGPPADRPADLRQAAGELQRQGLGGDPGGGAPPAA